MPRTSLKGARTHNLKSIDLELRPGEVVAITGVSGAGKSSLAMDTLYAEGQRRFVESFSPYARQFLERLPRPPLDELALIPAGIAVDRRAPVKSSRSTVATMSDLEAYLSALFVREGRPVCPEHGREAIALDATQAADRLLEVNDGARAVIAYPLAVRGKEHYLELREQLLHEGYRRLWLDGQTQDLDDVRPSEALAAGGSIQVIVDRTKVHQRERQRVTQSLETAWNRGGGLAHVHTERKTVPLRSGLSCPECARPLNEPRVGMFSYESPLGACPSCRGFGRTLGVDLDKVLPNRDLSIDEGVIRPWRGQSTQWERAELRKLCRRHKIPTDRAFRSLSKAQQNTVLHGDGSFQDGKFPGVLGWFAWLETRTYKMHVRVLLSRYRSYDLCEACEGQRLNPEALSFRVGGLNLAQWHRLEIGEAARKLRSLETHTGQGALVKKELLHRLTYLERVGLGYLTLDRQARTLSGGEAQRVTLTAALGTSLHNALFVLDEPSVGLHPSDVEALGGLIRELALRNNVVLLVEHDPALIAQADRVVELGPEAGSGGGQIVADGTPKQLSRRKTATARALKPALSDPGSVRREPRAWLRVTGARENNLSGFDVDLPLGVLCAVTGPSGSGKTTLAVDIVYRALCRQLGQLDSEPPGAFSAIRATEAVREVRLVDQAPLGRTSRGNAATYTKAWDTIRARFAKEPKAQASGLTPAHFSFNVEGGRCDACAGEGFETVEMQFLADVRLECPVCRGQRFKPEVLSIRHRGLTVAQTLSLTVDEALARYAKEPAVLRALSPVKLLGLGYLRLGQPLSSLSGGEAQRLKLARALTELKAGALLILDEPSAGLHVDEVEMLLGALNLIVKAGASVFVVEHDLQVIRRADYVVDMGPGSGQHGGHVVATATPEVLATLDTKTGRALRRSENWLALSAPVDKAHRRKLETAPVLSVEHAREHNLKGVSVSVPHQALSVVTGPSGSGKSTLAFDVVFAEGQRRFLETLTPYARQFLPSLPRPDVDQVSGVPPAIALEQRTSRAGANSTVATVTEVAHYLRLAYAKLGVPHCPEHQAPIASRTFSDVFAELRAQRGRKQLLAPVVQARKGTYLDVFTAAAKQGFDSAYCDGKRVSTDDPPRLSRSVEHDIDLVIAEEFEPQTAPQDLVEMALDWGQGALKLRSRNGTSKLFSMKSACPVCALAIPELDPRFFSFNTRQGRCPKCEGTGFLASRSPKRGRKAEPEAELVKCTACDGTRLSEMPRAVRLLGETYAAFSARSVGDALKAVEAWKFQGAAAQIANPIIEELLRRLRFLTDVGLDYLALDRNAHTLSGGEMQRLRLAAQLGAGLTGALYVLDEPTIGLHPRDTGRLLRNLRRLVELGSTVLVVEHDADTIRAADHLIDLGPHGGRRGGQVVAEGPPQQVLTVSESPTGRALSAPPVVRAPREIAPDAHWLELQGVREHNLKNVTLRIPLRHLTVVAGVSGSGKSTLVRQVLLPALRKKLGLVGTKPGQFDKLSNFRWLKRAVAVDQSPIGRTPRSVPATFLGIWDTIRRLYAATPEAMMLGFGPARFSFNTPAGGRCSVCDGQGAITHEMSFLPDVVSPCAACDGLRFEPTTLSVRYRGLSIGETLKLTAEQATLHFANHPSVRAPLETLCDLNAGYITLGQGSHTLSGGEAQRLKLAAELTASTRHEPTLYVLDEPTTGLHLADVSKLVNVLDRLVQRGDTLVVIEHHPEVIAGADYVVELGPEGGAAGGRIVAAATPSELLGAKTATAQVLESLLNGPGAKPARVSGRARARFGVGSPRAT